MISLIEGFAQDELSAVSIVSQVEPVRNRAPFSNRIAYRDPCCPRIHAPYNDVSTQIIARVIAGDESPRS